MKNIILLLSLFYSLNGSAEGRQFLMYGSTTGGGWGQSGDVKEDYNLVLRGDNIIAVGAYIYWHKTKNFPADYIATNEGADIHFFGPAHYTEAMLTCMYGKMLHLSTTDKIRIAIKGGMAFGDVQTPENFRQLLPRTTTYPYGYHYDYDVAEHYPLGVIIVPEIEWAISRYWGLRSGIAVMANAYHQTLTADIGVMYGLVRRKHKAVNTGRTATKDKK